MDRLAVAAVRAAHGTGGDVRVRSFSGETAHLLRLGGVTLRRGGVERAAEVVAARAAGPDVLLHFAGVDSREAARELAGWEIWVGRAHAAPLGEGEVYAADLVGCSLVEGGRRVGEVTAVCDTGGAPLLEVRTVDGRTVMVPYADHFVGEVDVGARRLQLRDPEVLA
jgi:16S rRNA processing protein RimM